jgi:hypothetical protein
MRFLATIVFGILALAAPARAEEPEGGLLRLAPAADSIGFRLLHGQSTADSVEYFSFGPRATFDVLGFLPELAGQRIRLAVELLGSTIDHRGTKHELALNPLLFEWRHDRGGAIVPFVEVGEGALWTTVRYLSLGGKFQFASHGGFGMHAFLASDVAITLGYRFRHISNAGLDEPNHGLNTHFFIVGLTRFPERTGASLGLLPPAAP